MSVSPYSATADTMTGCHSAGRTRPSTRGLLRWAFARFGFLGASSTRTLQLLDVSSSKPLDDRLRRAVVGGGRPRWAKVLTSPRPLCGGQSPLMTTSYAHAVR